MPAETFSADVALQPAALADQITYTDGTADDIDDAGYVLMRAFEETMGSIFPHGATPDHHDFRKSQIISSLATVQAYKNGIYPSPTRFAVARWKKPGNGHVNGHEERKRNVIGICIWSLENVASEEAKSREHFVPPSFGRGPNGANMDLFYKFRQAMVDSEKRVMGDRSYAYVKYLCVNPDVRRSGAGTGLMKLVRADCREHTDPKTGEPLPIYLDAAETSSAPSFYRKLGFQCIERAQAPGLKIGTLSMVLEGNNAAPLLDR